MKRFAEEYPYWDTTVHPAKSLGEIQVLLEDFGADAIMVTQGKSQGRTAWLIRFQWQDRSYHFVFTPLPLRYSNRSYRVAGKTVLGEDRARYQMGRIAMNLVKNVLAAAEISPDVLFGFLELPGLAPVGALPPTAAQVDVRELIGYLPNDLPLLESGESQ